MPLTRANGVQLYCESAGSGEPVVLLSGLGADAHFWYKQVPELSKAFRVITLDNRDSGRSEKVSSAYSVRTMADDVKGLLEALGIARTHIVGASLGGFIAQEVALAYPDSVRRVVLCCTSHGGPNAAPLPRETLALLNSRTGDPEGDLRAFLRIQFGTDYAGTHTAEIDQYVSWRVAHAQPLEAYHRQLAASAGHDTEDRLRLLRMPVLILHGARDRVLPVENARKLEAHIGHAEVRIFEEGGHLFLWECADEANRALSTFLAGSMVADSSDGRRAGRREETGEAR